MPVMMALHASTSLSLLSREQKRAHQKIGLIMWENPSFRQLEYIISSSFLSYGRILFILDAAVKEVAA